MGGLGRRHPAPLHRCGEERRHSTVNDQPQSPGSPAGSAPVRPPPDPGPEQRKNQATDLESPGFWHHSFETTTQASSEGQRDTLASEARSGLVHRGPRIGHFASGSPALWAGCSILRASFFFTAKQLIFLIDWRRGSGRGKSGGRVRRFCKRHDGSPQTACGHSGTTLPQTPKPQPQPGGEPPVRNKQRAEIWRLSNQCAWRKRPRDRAERERGRLKERGSRERQGAGGRH